MQPGQWADKEWVYPGVVIGTEETDLLIIDTTRASELDIQVDDSITPGTANITIKIYGSCDNGLNWFQLYFYDATANRWASASATNAPVHVAGTVVLYTTDNLHDLTKITGTRAGEDEGLVTITTRQKMAL